MADEIPERGVGVDQPGPAPRATRLRLAAGDGLDLDDVPVEPHTPVADAGGPRAQRVAVDGLRAAAEVDDELDGHALLVADHRQVADRHPGPRPGLEQRVQRTASGQPRPPIHQTDTAVTAYGGSKVGRLLFHAGWVAPRRRRLTASGLTAHTRPSGMWLFTTDGFYSAVTHREAPDTVVVRARAREDVAAAHRGHRPGHPRRDTAQRLPLPRLPPARHVGRVRRRGRRGHRLPQLQGRDRRTPGRRSRPRVRSRLGGHVRLPAAPRTGSIVTPPPSTRAAR